MDQDINRLESLQKEFVERFSRQKLETLTLEEYALNKQTGYKDSFCYWVETKLRGLGSIQGATSRKFGVYFGEVKSDRTLKWRWAKWTNSSFDVIRNELIELYDAGKLEDIEAIKRNKISPMFKGKILSLYFPQRYLNIFSKEHLIHFLNKLSIIHDEREDTIELSEKLIRYKNNNSLYTNMSAIEFGHELYKKYDEPSKNEIQSELADELYERRQMEKVNISFNKKDSFSKSDSEFNDLPEERPEKIETSFGQVYRIDSKISRQAIIDADYLCEYDNQHESFIRKDGLHRYTEAHHLIPRRFQDEFDYSLDVKANIVSLCSDCHNCLHYGKDNEKILKQLYDKRIERFKNANLGISFEKLKKFYE